MEKNANLELTETESQLILSGVTPERIKQNWGEITEPELLEAVATQKALTKELEKVNTDGCNKSDSTS